MKRKIFKFKQGEYSVKQYAEEAINFLKSKGESQFRFGYANIDFLVKGEEYYCLNELIDDDYNFIATIPIANDYIEKIECEPDEGGLCLEGTIYLYNE